MEEDKLGELSAHAIHEELQPDSLFERFAAKKANGVA
jgi:hypothetical protein